MNFKIVGTGSCVPGLIINNNQIAEKLDTTDEWIRTRTGIKQRHVLQDEYLQDLAVKAARAALSSAKTEAGELDLILCSTLQGDYITPSLACLIAGDLGAACPALDINGACTGFIYALDVASAYFESGKVKKVLIVCGDAMTRLADWDDRATCVLFGDGCGAVVLETGNSLLAIKLTVNGNKEHLNASAAIGNSPFTARQGQKSALYMNGKEIYKFAVSVVGADIEDVCSKAGLDKNQIDYYLLHQANIRIIETVRLGLKLPKEKFPTNVANYGNTSSATIPILLDELVREKKLKKHDILLLSAFGAGLTYGTCILEWSGNS